MTPVRGASNHYWVKKNNKPRNPAQNPVSRAEDPSPAQKKTILKIFGEWNQIGTSIKTGMGGRPIETAPNPIKMRYNTTQNQLPTREGIKGTKTKKIRHRSESNRQINGNKQRQNESQRAINEAQSNVGEKPNRTRGKHEKPSAGVYKRRTIFLVNIFKNICYKTWNAPSTVGGSFAFRQLWPLKWSQ